MEALHEVTMLLLQKSPPVPTWNLCIFVRCRLLIKCRYGPASREPHYAVQGTVGTSAGPHSPLAERMTPVQDGGEAVL